MAETARAIIRYPYESQTGPTYNSVVLVRDKRRKVNGVEQVALPGGQIKRGENAERRVIKELEEELGADIRDLRKKCDIYIRASDTTHHLYEADIAGKGPSGLLILNYETLRNPTIHPEIGGLAFLNAGGHNRIPTDLLQGHVQGYLQRYGAELGNTRYWHQGGVDFKIGASDMSEWRSYIKKLR